MIDKMLHHQFQSQSLEGFRNKFPTYIPILSNSFGFLRIPTRYLLAKFCLFAFSIYLLLAVQDLPYSFDFLLFDGPAHNLMECVPVHAAYLVVVVA